MITIPTNNASIDATDLKQMVDKACKMLTDDIERQRKLNYKVIHAQISTEHCATGGFKMPVINEVAKRFAREGWFAYLVRGGMYRDWTWLSVFSEPQHEGYTNANIPNYYQRVRD